jgi:hypothetical protein
MLEHVHFCAEQSGLARCGFFLRKTHVESGCLV